MVRDPIYLELSRNSNKTTVLAIFTFCDQGQSTALTEWRMESRDRVTLLCSALCLLHNSLLALRKASTRLHFAFVQGRSFSVQSWEWSYLLQWNMPNHWLPIKVHTTQQEGAVTDLIIMRKVRWNCFITKDVSLCLQPKHCQQFLDQGMPQSIAMQAF